MSQDSFQLKKHFRHSEVPFDKHLQSSWTDLLVNFENGTCLTRTPLRWFQLILFYIIFYGCLVLLWWSCYKVFQQTLTDEKPKWFLNQPGFSFEPAIENLTYFQISYNEHSQNEVEAIANHIQKALEKYGGIPHNYFGNCQIDNYFGYKTRQPCVFLKINRIINFKTEPLDSLKILPQNAPLELRKYLRELSKQELKARLWISCESKPSLKFVYYPQRFYETAVVDVSATNSHKSLNGSFYSESDFKRIVALKLNQITPNTMYQISCCIWAKNIARDLHREIGKGCLWFYFKTNL